MKKKKSKFLTFVFSLLPGAGHMYMGFMKMGLSFMSAFLVGIFLSSWLDIGPLLVILPLIWFYSFFDCMNKRYSTEEEFLILEDNYLFSLDKFVKLDENIFKKRRVLAGVLLLFLGGYLIWNNTLHLLARYIPDRAYEVINNLTRIAPQIIVGVAIVIAGVKLIQGKKKESDMNA
ncbi:MAG: hypothetical protein H7Y18_10180 [Clostridiaceae bacterium]|nr:hypothetical protein [Clostridiaceae bacterium]